MQSRLLLLILTLATSGALAAEPGSSRRAEKGATRQVEKPAAKPTETKPEEPGKAKPGPDESKLKETTVPTQHTLKLEGHELKYTATAGTILLRDAEDKPTASVFYIAYTLNGVKDLSQRPVTFSFNGGPGSSSVWMHLGLLGPKRVALKEDGTALPPPYKLVDNEYSLLDETDLVFIDPVSTGYSRAAKPDEARQFHGLEGDLRSVGEFIRLYTTRSQRWGSPKFIIGESYGTTRAAGLTGELRDRHRMNVNGVMLVSTVLNFATLALERGNDLPYVLYLPTYTAIAWYHKKLPSDLQGLPLPTLVERAETFALKDYQEALLRGASLSPEKRKAVVAELARFTGLPEVFVDRANLRVGLGRFASELLRSDGLVLGRYDGRYTGFVRDHLAASMEYDPSFEAVAGVFGATFNDYVRSQLKYETDLNYELLARVGPWDWGEQNSYVNVAETLAESLTRNPFLRVHVSSGYYDLATPRLAIRYTLDHLQIAPELMRNITLDTYTAGHMMYLNQPDLKKQKSDLARFIRDASGVK